MKTSVLPTDEYKTLSICLTPDGMERLGIILIRAAKEAREAGSEGQICAHRDDNHVTVTWRTAGELCAETDGVTLAATRLYPKHPVNPKKNGHRVP